MRLALSARTVCGEPFEGVVEMSQNPVDLTKHWTWELLGHWARAVDCRRHRAQRGIVR
jgi:hypothetical protein